MTEPTTSYPPQTNHWIAKEIDAGTFEGIEQSWCRELPVSSGSALDLGAGVGLVTRVLATKFPRVYAVEGNAALASHWFANQMNVGLQDVRAACRWSSIVAAVPDAAADIVLRNAIVGDTRMRVCDDEWWKSTSSAKPITTDLPTHEVVGDSVAFIALLDSLRPDCVVMDIEGAEYAELSAACTTASDLLRGINDFIIELHPGLWVDPSQRDNIVQALLDTGFALKRREVADGWPPGTKHPIGIEHVWLTRTPGTA